MRFGFFYTYPWTYNFLIWMLYRGRPLDRIRCVAQKIEDGQTILDLCAGTDLLFNLLHKRVKSYTAIDINPGFTDAMNKKGITAITADINTVKLPVADVVTMNSSLCHFRNQSHIISKMLKAARDKVIILEPIRNCGASRNRILRFIARQTSTVNGVVPNNYFTPETFTRVMKEIPGLQSLTLLDNKRDMLAVLKGQAAGM
jgi:hypothetical protein